jgi:hypothetical protein
MECFSPRPKDNDSWGRRKRQLGEKETTAGGDGNDSCGIEDSTRHVIDRTFSSGNPYTTVTSSTTDGSFQDQTFYYLLQKTTHCPGATTAGGEGNDSWGIDDSTRHVIDRTFSSRNPYTIVTLFY